LVRGAAIRPGVGRLTSRCGGPRPAVALSGINMPEAPRPAARPTAPPSKQSMTTDGVDDLGEVAGCEIGRLAGRDLVTFAEHVSVIGLHQS
jgi:hypothetical protein